MCTHQRVKDGLFTVQLPVKLTIAPHFRRLDDCQTEAGRQNDRDQEMSHIFPLANACFSSQHPILMFLIEQLSSTYFEKKRPLEIRILMCNFENHLCKKRNAYIQFQVLPIP